jgi:hypothetical protein
MYWYTETFDDGSCLQHYTHKVSQVNRSAGTVVDLYQFSDQVQNEAAACVSGQSGGVQSDVNNVETIIPHPSGPVFIQDNTQVTVIDPTTAQTIAAIPLDLPSQDSGGIVGVPQIGQMIVAGDGAAYVPYVYTVNEPGGPPYLEDDILKLLRVLPDGSFSTTQLGNGSTTTCSAEPRFFCRAKPSSPMRTRE